MTTRNEETANWFAAARRGVMTVDERAAFEAWKSAGANAKAMAEMEAVWEALEAVAPAIANRAPARAARPRPARAMMLAVACVASLGIGVMSYGGDPQFWTSLDWSNR
jgi:transmembrane sensor